MQLAFVNKAGWLLKRGKLQRKWVKRWFSVNSHKGSFRYCNIPGSVSLPAKQIVISRKCVFQNSAINCLCRSSVYISTYLYISYQPIYWIGNSATIGARIMLSLEFEASIKYWLIDAGFRQRQVCTSRANNGGFFH